MHIVEQMLLEVGYSNGDKSDPANGIQTFSGQTLLTAHEFAQYARSMEAKRPVSHHGEEI